MARNFRELRDEMSPARQAKAKAREMMVEMLLAEIRRESALTQCEVADIMGISQPALSKLEAPGRYADQHAPSDHYCFGGELEMVVKMPHRTIRLTSFCQAVSRA